MKNIIKQFTKQAQAYIDFRAPQTNEVNLKANKIAAIIKEAQEKHLALHAIYLDESFTETLSNMTLKVASLFSKFSTKHLNHYPN